MDKIDGLVRVLLDDNAEIGERDDAAIDLGQFNDDRALSALIQIVTDIDENEFIYPNCGESIAQIWSLRHHFDIDLYKKMVPPAQNEIIGYFEVHHPDLVEKYGLKSQA